MTTSERLDLGSEVELSHLRTEVTFSGTLSLGAEEGEEKAIFGNGRGAREPEIEHLAHIVEVLNDRFGLNLDDADKLLFDQFEEEWASDDDLTAQARGNSIENFKLVFDPKFLSTIVTRMDANEAIFKRLLDDEEFRAVLADFYLKRVYIRARSE